MLISCEFGLKRIRKWPLLIELLRENEHGSHKDFVVCVSVVYNSLYCRMLQEEQIVPLVLFLQPHAVILRSPWVLVCSLMWEFGWVKNTLQQIWSSEGRRAAARECFNIHLLLFYGRDMAVHHCIPCWCWKQPQAGDGIFWNPFQLCNVQAECEAQPLPRKRGETVPAVLGSSWKSHYREMYVFI